MKRFFLMLAMILPLVSAGTAIASQETVFNTSNGNLSLSSLKGQVVYLDFWASWCKPCRHSFPWMNSMHQKYAKQGLKIIAVNVDKEPELVKKFLAEIPAQFTIAYDQDGKLAEQYQLKGMPSSYLIDREGNLKKAHVGFRERDVAALETLIKNELKN